ncbi:hypothetical protein RvY_14852 [Ramazzottius varieornatus]|uniref:Uncharacterized protein n=1 Tax=Ramazzottius varieornatus TaxID=947166 RepID=A0A1D1VXP4_RAMVA|nr:hypothetical protein RvY_14852 [Ramazzottius varieornatus]
MRPNDEGFWSDAIVYKPMTNHETRFVTFYNWQPYELASAGFFCKEHSTGLVECFHCGLALSYWQTTDTPMIEHIRHRPGFEFVKFKCGQKMVDQSATEYGVELTKEDDFLNIDGRPTFNQYLSWLNFMKRLGVVFEAYDPNDFLRWRRAKKADHKVTANILALGSETVEKRLRTLQNPLCQLPKRHTALDLAQDGLIFSS